MSDDMERAKDQAKAQLESIKEMVAALEVDYDRLQYLEEFQTALSQEDAEELSELMKAANDCRSQDEAEQAIQESPLSVQVRSGWTVPNPDEIPEPEEFMILLCTGGPAVRIIGDLTEHNCPYNYHLEYQDWFTKWEEYRLTSDETALLRKYCEHFYYGE